MCLLNIRRAIWADKCPPCPHSSYTPEFLIEEKLIKRANKRNTSPTEGMEMYIIHVLIKIQVDLHIQDNFVAWSKRRNTHFIPIHYCGDFTRGFDTQNYPKLQASLGTQPENTHRFQRQTQPNPYPWIFSGNTLGYPRVPALNFYPWVPWVPVLNFYPWVPWTQFKLVYIVYWEKML